MPDNEDFQDAVLVTDSALSREVAITKLDSFRSVNEMEDYCQKLIDGRMIPPGLKSPQAVMSVVLMGKELGLGSLTSLNNIVVIQGRPTLGIHSIGALLRKAGGATQTMEDFVPVMGTGENADKVVDYRTTIRFFRPYRDRVLEEDASFSWKEATKMGLTDKDNWKRMPKVMLYSRCFALGARRIVPDALLGVYETAEAADFSNQKYKVDEEGKVILL